MEKENLYALASLIETMAGGLHNLPMQKVAITNIFNSDNSITDSFVSFVERHPKLAITILGALLAPFILGSINEEIPWKRALFGALSGGAIANLPDLINLVRRKF